jgi:glutamine cyclotransferase
MGARQDVLNGIAYDAANNVFLLTGKLWPRFYVSFVDNVNL